MNVEPKYIESLCWQVENYKRGVEIVLENAEKMELLLEHEQRESETLRLEVDNLTIQRNALALVASGFFLLALAALI